MQAALDALTYELRPMILRIASYAAVQQAYISHSLQYTADELKQQLRTNSPWVP